MATAAGEQRKLLLTVKEAAELLGYHPQTVYHKIWTGEIPEEAIKRFGEKKQAIRISRAWLERWAGGGVE